MQDLNQQLTSKVESLNELVRTTLEKVDAAERKVNESAKKSQVDMENNDLKEKEKKIKKLNRVIAG